MDVAIREAKPEDKNHVLEFTEKTWETGDYIHLVWDEWLNDPDGLLLVAVLANKPVGLLHVRFMPDKSAWLEGLRVHPDYRRKGIATKLNKEAIKKCSKMGINTFRGAIFEWNVPSLKLATARLGFKILEPKWIVFGGKIEELQGNSVCDPIPIQPEEFLTLVKNVDYVKWSGGFIFYKWAWFKLSKASLIRLLEKDRDVITLKCGSLPFLVRKAKSPRPILEINMFRNDPRGVGYLKSLALNIANKMKFGEDLYVRVSFPDETKVSKRVFELVKNTNSINRLYIFEAIF